MAATIEQLSRLILGFEENYAPSQAELSEAFRRASLKFHPDAGGDVRLFRGLTLARQSLQVQTPEARVQTATQEDLCRSIHTYAEKCAINMRMKGVWMTSFSLTFFAGVVTVSVKNGWDIEKIEFTGPKTDANYSIIAGTLKWLADQNKKKLFENYTVQFTLREGGTCPIRIEHTLPKSWFKRIWGKLMMV